MERGTKGRKSERLCKKGRTGMEKCSLGKDSAAEGRLKER